MGITVIKPKGDQKSYYRVRRQFNGKVFCRKFPLTEKGKKAALEYDKNIEGKIKFGQSLHWRRMLLGKKIRGMNVLVRYRNGKKRVYLVIDVKGDEGDIRKAFTVKDMPSLPHVYDKAIAFLHKKFKHDYYTKQSLKKDIVSAYLHYFTKIEKEFE